MNRLTATGVPVQLNRNIATVMQEHSSGDRYMYLFTAMETFKNERHFIHLPFWLSTISYGEQVYAMPWSLLTFLTISILEHVHPSGFSRVYY